MIDLHERLSEYSYGYGVTRETEVLLSSLGVRAVPFLPNLIQENDLGFDVGFNRAGAALLLQFKLGHSLKTFRRTNFALPPPPLDRPYWRFNLDTSEPEGQFETLLKAERNGAETYYVAPRFSDWVQYAEIFDQGKVLENSLLIRPSEVRNALENNGDPDGPHRIVYDRRRVHVCSRPTRISEVNSDEAIKMVANVVRERRQPLGELLQGVFEGFSDRLPVRRVTETDERKSTRPVFDRLYRASSEISYRATRELTVEQRTRRFETFLLRAKTRDHAVAAAVGMELWALGIQLVVAVDKDL